MPNSPTLPEADNPLLNAWLSSNDPIAWIGLLGGRPSLADGLPTQPDTRKAALTALAEEGAHFVLCGTKGGPKAARVKGWPNKPASLQEVLQHRGLVGVVPALARLRRG